MDLARPDGAAYEMVLAEAPPPESWSPRLGAEPAGFWFAETKDGVPTGLWLILQPADEVAMGVGGIYRVREVHTAPFDGTATEAMIRVSDGLKAVDPAHRR